MHNKRPLTGYEVIKADPFIRKIEGVGILKIKQWSAMVCYEVFQGKKALEPYWGNIEKGDDISESSINIFYYIANKLWELSEKPLFFKKRFKERLFKWCIDNAGQALVIWEDLCKSQTCTFFFSRLPAEIANGSGKRVQRDWFIEYCGEYDPKTTPWIVIRNKREVEKARSIEEWHRNKEARKKNK